MERREFIIGSSVVATTTILSGCNNSSSDPDGSGGSGGSGPASPDEVVREYLNTLYGGTPSEINEFLHPEAEIPEFTESQTERYEGQTIQVNSVEVTSQDGDMAEVTASVTADTGSREISDTADYELRKTSGEWKIYAINP